MKFKYRLFISLLFLLSACSRHKHHFFQGYVEGENIYLASPYSGHLIEKNVVRGQFVKKGDLLFKLDPYPQLINIKAAEAELLQAKKIYQDLIKPRRTPEIEAIEAQISQTESQLALAELRLKRIQQLYIKKAIEKEAVDEAEARDKELQHIKKQYQANLNLALQGSREEQINAQQAQISLGIAKVELAKWELGQKNIYSPGEGQVVDTFYNLGDFVASQQPLASLLTPENIRIEFFVPVGLLPSIKIGQQIHFTCEGSDSPNEAVISYISPEVEYMPPLVYSRENSDKLIFRIKAQIKNPKGFHPGQPVEVDLQDER